VLAAVPNLEKGVAEAADQRDVGKQLAPRQLRRVPASGVDGRRLVVRLDQLGFGLELLIGGGWITS